MSVWNKVGNSIKVAATVVSQKSKELATHLSAAPSSIKCSNAACPYEVMVPPNTFDWACPKCTLVNKRENEKCSACLIVKPDFPNPKVQCSMCQAWTEVPTSNAKKALNSAASNTKAFAIKVKDETVKTYEHMKSAPQKFHCQHCATELVNPNPPEQPPATEMKAEPGAGSSAAAHSSDSAGVSGSVSPRIEQVICSVCHRLTDVPKSNFRDMVTSSGQSFSRSMNKVYYGLAEKRYADCPICRHPQLVPEATIQAATAAAAAAAPAVAPPAYNAPGGAPAAASPGVNPIKVDLKCEKCGSAFPAKV